MKDLYNKIMLLLCGIPTEKALHFIAGIMVVAIAAIIFPFWANYVLLFSIIIGFLKELVDKLNYGIID